MMVAMMERRTYYVTGPAIHALTWIISFTPLHTPGREVLLVITPILQMRKRRLKEVWSLAQSNTTSGWWGWDENIICKALGKTVSPIPSTYR